MINHLLLNVCKIMQLPSNYENYKNVMERKGESGLNVSVTKGYPCTTPGFLGELCM